MQKYRQDQQKTLLGGIFVLLLLIAGVTVAMVAREQSSITANTFITTEDDTLSAVESTNTSLSASLTEASNYKGCRIILFSAAWDSFSVRAREMLTEQLVDSTECFVELDINTNRVEAEEFEINMPPGLVIFPKDDTDTLKIYSNLSIDRFAKLISTF